MTESELLQYALRESRKLNNLLKCAYDVHDHDADFRGGVALSAARLSAEAVEQEILSILMSMKSN